VARRIISSQLIEAPADAVKCSWESRSASVRTGIPAPRQFVDHDGRLRTGTKAGYSTLITGSARAIGSEPSAKRISMQGFEHSQDFPEDFDEKYSLSPAAVSFRPRSRLSFSAVTTADISLPWTGSACE